jgi:hypothetical protein
MDGPALLIVSDLQGGRLDEQRVLNRPGSLEKRSSGTFDYCNAHHMSIYLL